MLRSELAAAPEQPIAPAQAPGDEPRSGAKGDAKHSEVGPDATDTATAETGRPEDLSIAGVQMPATTSEKAGSQGADQPSAGSFGPVLRAAAPGFGPGGSAADSDRALASGPVPGAQISGDQMQGDAVAGGSQRSAAPGRGEITPGAVAHQGPGTPEQPVAASTEESAAAAAGGSGRADPTGRTGMTPRDGNRTPGSAGMQVGGQQAGQAQAETQGRTQSGMESAARAAAAAPPGQTDGATARAADPGAAGVQQAQSGAAPATNSAPGPRAEGRAAESAPSAANATAQNATGQSATDARSAADPQTIRTADGKVGVRVGAGALVSNVVPVARASEDGLFGADPLAMEFGPGEIRGTDRSAATTPPVLPASVQAPRQVTLQIAEMVRTSGERAVELRLHPEELGRVQMTLSQDATGTLTVALNVERPETLDLLRRNIDLLGADLRALGYESVDFSFQGDGAGGGAGAGTDRGAPNGTAAGPMGRETELAAAQAAGPQHIGRGAGAPGDGIDIRL